MKSLFIILNLLLAFPSCVESQDISSPVSDAIEGLLSQEALHAKLSTRNLYSKNQYRLLWTTKTKKEILEAVNKSSTHGLNPQDYHLGKIQSATLLNPELDILLTDAYLTLAGHLLEGKLDPLSIEPSWNIKKTDRDLVSYLLKSIEQGDIFESLEKLAPPQPRYHILQDALEYYRKLASTGEQGKVADGKLLYPGMVSDRVIQIRERLQAAGYNDLETTNETLYDGSLVEAIRLFQENANLEPDGIIGQGTVQKLNRSPQDHIDQIRVNLERWRWLPEDLGERHVRINIADYTLEVFEDSAIVSTHDVVVGRAYRKTPVFSGNISYLVLNPWWEVPPSLAKKDVLPKIAQDPSLYSSLGYQVVNEEGIEVPEINLNWKELSKSKFPFRLRQKPGINNALGKVKFMFPNQYNVYLHDTPAKDLFEKTRRDFSSGCIRVKDPIDLVEWVLKEESDWNRDLVEKAISSGKVTTIRLQKNIPVHLLYWTVVIDGLQGSVRFIDDIYNRDQQVLQMLDKPYG